MVDIYDNLEDYEEICNYEQLKSENQELKENLEKSEAALSKLKEDFDNLAAAHNALLQNFSSLLKTARAEVERKTDAITHINAEKDKLFLSLLSDSTNKRNRRDRGKSRIRKRSGSVEICDLRLGSKSLKEVPYGKGDHLERKENASSDIEVTKQIKTGIGASNPELKTGNKDKAGNSNKENEVENEPRAKVENLRPCNISNRRKSMPALRHGLTFSSDDENDSNSTDTQKPLYSRDERLEVQPERHNKIINRSSEASSLDKYSDSRQLRSKTRLLSKPELQKESFGDKHVRQSRYEAHEKYRKEERYESKLRRKERRGRSSHGRLLESRYKSRRSRKDSEDYDHRQENDRYASPPDRYHRRVSRDRRTHREHEKDEKLEHYVCKNIEICHKKTAEKDARDLQIGEKRDHAIDRHKANSNETKRDESDGLQISHTIANAEMPSSCEVPKRYKIPKLRSEKENSIVDRKSNYDKHKHEKLHKKIDFGRNTDSHKERLIHRLDKKMSKSFENLSEQDHVFNRNMQRRHRSSVKNSDNESDSERLTQHAKKHDSEYESTLKIHSTPPENHDFIENDEISDDTHEQFMSRRNKPITLFDRRMTRHLGIHSHAKIDDIEEPVSKRRRIGSHSQIDEECVRENLTVNIHEKAYIEYESRFGLTSCQSPDAILGDKFTYDEPMREIMDTAKTKLEDPRFTSSRYMAVSDTSQIRLSVSSRHIHMRKLSWPLDTGDKTRDGTKYQEYISDSFKEHSDHNSSNECSQQNNRLESEIDEMNESLESGEIEDFYSDLITATDNNKSTVPTVLPQTASSNEEAPNTSCATPKKNLQIPKLKPDIINVSENKDLVPSEEKSELSSSNCNSLHTKELSLDVSKDPEKPRPEITLNVPQISDAPMPLSALFGPSKREDTAGNKKQTLDSSIEIEPDSSTKIIKNDHLPEERKPEKISNGLRDKSPIVPHDDTRNKRTSDPQISDKEAKKSSKQTSLSKTATVKKRGKCDIPANSVVGIAIESPATPCDLSKKCKSSKIKPDITHVSENKDLPVEESSNSIHTTNLLSFDVVFTDRDIQKQRLDTISQFENESTPVGALFVTSKTENTVINKKQYCESMRENKRDSSIETSEKDKIPKERKPEKTSNALKNKREIVSLADSGTHTPDSKGSDEKAKKTEVVKSLKNCVDNKRINMSAILQPTENTSLSSGIIDTPAKKLLVQGDLELSDEDSECTVQLLNNLQNQKSSAIKKSEKDKKPKQKTKTHKSKDSEQNHIRTDKKIDDSKAKDINIQFSELFGETSLITPEDLGLPTQMITAACSVFSPPQCTQVLDNGDCNPVKMHIETAKSDKVQTRSSKAKKKTDDKNIINDTKPTKLPEIPIDKVTEKCEKHILPKKRKNDIVSDITPIESNNMPSVEVDLFRVIPTTIVKTVIISSGKQPQCVTDYESNGNLAVTETNTEFAVTEPPKPKQILGTKMADGPIKAVATSTPMREHEKRSTPVPLPENGSSNSTGTGVCDSQTTRNDTSTQYITNSVPQSATTGEAPDVRVFITRRKKKRLSK